METRKNTQRQQGLTLIELVVVLVILAALSGIAVGVAPSFLQQTHGSTSANSIRNGENAINARLVSTGGVIGNNFDGLVTVAGVVPDYIAEAVAVVPFTVTAGGPEEDALAEVGITTYIPAAFDDFAALLAGGAENATFDGHDYASGPQPVAGAQIAELTGPSLARFQDDFNIDPAQFTNVFVFGLGQESSLVGLNGVFKECPVHTPGEGSAVTQYSRYVVLVGFDGAEAQYLGLTCIDDGENFNGINRNLGEFFEASF